MKALSIRQPWAWLIVNGHKDVENRSWQLPRSFDLPQRIYVHAGVRADSDLGLWVHGLFTSADVDAATVAEFWSMTRLGARQTRLDPRFGAIVGEVTIVDLFSPCNPNGLDDDRDESPWYVGDPFYGFALADPVAYDQPIPYKGSLGFFVPEL